MTQQDDLAVVRCRARASLLKTPLQFAPDRLRRRRERGIPELRGQVERRSVSECNRARGPAAVHDQGFAWRHPDARGECRSCDHEPSAVATGGTARRGCGGIRPAFGWPSAAPLGPRRWHRPAGPVRDPAAARSSGARRARWRSQSSSAAAGPACSTCLRSRRVSFSSGHIRRPPSPWPVDHAPATPPRTSRRCISITAARSPGHLKRSGATRESPPDRLMPRSFHGSCREQELQETISNRGDYHVRRGRLLAYLSSASP